MPRYSRRATLVGLGSLLIAGCAGQPSNGEDDTTQPGDTGTDEPTATQNDDGDGVPPSEDDFPDNSAYSERVETIDQIVSISAGTWKSWSFSIDESTTMEYDFLVQQGPAVDVIVLREDEYPAFEAGEEFDYLEDASFLDSTEDTVRTTLEAGSYRILIDNSSRGSATPPEGSEGKARVQLYMLLAR